MSIMYIFNFNHGKQVEGQRVETRAEWDVNDFRDKWTDESEFVLH